MASDTRRSDRERYRYGICLNDECEKCKNKEVQQIPMRKDFVCEECGKELRECPPPSGSSKKLPIIIAVVIIAVIAIVGCFIGFGGSSEKSVVPPIDSTGVDTTKVDTDTQVKPQLVEPQGGESQKVVEETPKTPSESGSSIEKPKKPAESTSASKGSLNLGYGKYTGGTKNGKPDGMGTMRYTSSHQIESRDSKGRTAEAGDYVTGEWKDGHLVQGRWFDSSNNVKGSLMIGM